jgi:signal transduction histidine kinase
VKEQAAGPDEQRVLMRMATLRDAQVTREVLARNGIAAEPCADMVALVDEFGRGAGALMLAEEDLQPAVLDRLTGALAQQPAWSDVPVLVLARTGAGSRAIAQAMERLPNTTVIERPVRVATLVSTLRSTLRARRRQYELRAVLDGLRLADQRKTEFLATLAHELRNPLAPIHTALALLARQPLPAAQAERYHALMRRQVEHMVRLVDDLMEVSRITRGKVSLQRVPLLLEAAIRDAVELSRPQVEAGRHALELVPADEPLLLRGDAVRLTQVFSNLLNNAAKYTPPGGRLRLAVRREGDAAVVTVSDNGIGLEPQMLGAVFDMFVQVGGSARGGQGGLGVGLTLVKSLVEMHGGSVKAASEGIGRGATFTVRLPLAEAPSALAAGASTAAAAVGWRGRRVLVADDNRDAADTLAELLRALGAEVVVAYDGMQALRLAECFGPDVAVLDIGMPGQDGCAVASALRERRDGKPLKLIALTGWGQAADRERVAAAGFDHHLLKPVGEPELSALLAT